MTEESADEAHERVAVHRRLVQSLEGLFYLHDPVGIAFGDNPDEYAPEAESIAVRIPHAESVADVLRIVHEEFVRWFDDDTAGPAASYQAVAEEVWMLLKDSG